MRTKDGDIIRRCLNGEPEAFGFLVDKYRSSIYAFAYTKLGNFQDAEDVTQEVFLKAYRNLRKLRCWDSFFAWLYSITANLCKYWIIEQAKRPDRESIHAHSPAVLDDFSVKSRKEEELHQSLHEALYSLPEIYRQVLILYYFGSMNSFEIARFLGASPTAIRKRLSRARSQLREEMIAMMDAAFEGHKLQASFTFRIVEAVKRIRINPMPRTAGLPWGMTLAAGIITAILSVGTHLNLTNTEPHASISSLSGESMVQEAGEFPVDVMKMSDMTITSDQHLPGNGSGNVVPDLENALFMTPQAEGGTWTKRADMPTARHSLASCVVDKRIYTFGGIGRIRAVEQYDPNVDKWVKKADRELGSDFPAVVVGGQVYVFNNLLWQIENYDPVEDNWQIIGDMPKTKLRFSAVSLNSKIYIVGGMDAINGAALSTLEEYDPITNIWTEKADMPTPRWWFSTCVLNGKIYAIGGLRDQGGVPTPVSAVEEYDPATDTWTNRRNLPMKIHSLSASAVYGKIYAIGGVEFNRILSAVHEYDPAENIWIKQTDMPTARLWLTTSVVNDRIYAIGGSPDGPNSISTVEEYVPETEDESINIKGKLPTTWGEVRTASSK